MTGGPGHLENTLKQIQRRIFLALLISNVGLIIIWLALDQLTNINPSLLLGVSLAAGAVVSFVISILLARSVSSPLKALSEAILHISPSPLDVKSPDLEKLRIGKELIANLIRQVHELGTQMQTAQPNSQVNQSLQQLPIGVISINEAGNITFSNQRAIEIASSKEDLTGKNLYSSFDLLFQGTLTLQAWIDSVRASQITAQYIWRGVRITSFEGSVKYVDMAATYSKTSGDANEVMLAMFDQTATYSQQDDALTFIALAVHELRTPLTILRGYIEVFEEILAKNPDPQQQKFIKIMRASAENLTAFIGNILDVARIDSSQLTLKLNEEKWKDVVNAIIVDLKLRAEVNNKDIQVEVAENLPAVGIDRISIAEVITNLLDNAMKYSPPDKTIIKITSQLDKDGNVETTVQDFGVGIPESVIPHLFQKFVRNHRNRASIGGTGLGLYLSKALISAHGGNIWIRSKEGEGTTVGFTVLPFDKVADSQKKGDNAIIRNPHGWIKNHSLSRQ